MAPRPLTPGAPDGFMRHARGGMPGSHWLPSLATPTLKPHLQLHSRRRRQPILRRPRDGLNTVRPRPPGCGRCVLTPPRGQRRPTPAATSETTLRTNLDRPRPVDECRSARPMPLSQKKNNGTSRTLQRCATAVLRINAYPRCHVTVWNPASVNSWRTRPLVRARSRRLPISVGASQAEIRSVRTRFPPRSENPGALGKSSGLVFPVVK